MPSLKSVASIFFPKIFRFITEQGKFAVISFVSGIVIIGIVLQITRLSDNLTTIKALEQRRIALTKELSYWQDLARQYDNYRDAHFQIASIEYQLGNMPQARKAIQKVLVLDPNFEEGKVLGAKIGADN